VSEPLPLFLYGTLRSDGPMGGLVASGRRHPATVRGRLWHLPAGYPALQPGGESLVHGELTDPVPLAKLQVLDAYEGVHDGLYARVVVSALPRRGRLVAAWAWVMADPRRHGGRVVPGGRWRPPPPTD